MYNQKVDVSLNIYSDNKPPDDLEIIDIFFNFITKAVMEIDLPDGTSYILTCQPGKFIAYPMQETKVN